MDEDVTEAAWHQLELECIEQFSEYVARELQNDPDYPKWLEWVTQQREEKP